MAVEKRPPMKTIGGKSVRAEIDDRLYGAFVEGRNLGIEESIAFLRLSGFGEGAEALDQAAFALPAKVDGQVADLAEPGGQGK